MVMNETLHLQGMVANPNGSDLLRAEVEGSALAPEEVGNRLAQKMVELGASSLIG
jgi:hydroxymethylbilane synthase